MFRPILDDFELPLVQVLDGLEAEAVERHAVPALEGDFLQGLGRRAVRFRLAGVLVGADAARALETLRNKHRAAAPLKFVADIATATRVSEVLIESLEARDIAGRPERTEFRLSLIEYIPAPPPHVDPVPPIPPECRDTTKGALDATVVVVDDPGFDLGTLTVQVAGIRDEGTRVSATLTRRTDSMWTADPLPAGFYTVTAAAATPPLSGSARVRVEGCQRPNVTIHLKEGTAVAKGFIVHFWFDRAFIEPCLRQVVHDAAAYAQAHPDEKILIVGDTDLRASVDPINYNQALSERRARAVYAYLTAGRALDRAAAEWNALRHSGRAPVIRLEDNWGVREYQQMLAGLDFYHGQIDEQHGPLTDTAVRQFQSEHGLRADGIVDDNTWRTLITAYLSDNPPPSPPDAQFFPNCAPEVVKWIGSGMADPVDPKKGAAWRPNRRVEIVFVKAQTLPGLVTRPLTFDLPTPGAVNAGWCVGTNAPEPPILSRGTPRPNTIFVQPPVPGSITNLKGRMTFEDGSPGGGMQYVLTAPDGEYLDGERPGPVKSGVPIPGTSKPDGTFQYDRDTPTGLYIVSVSGRFTVRLKSDPPNSGKSPILCARLDGSQNLDVVLAPAGSGP